MRYMIISLVDNASGEIIHTTDPTPFEKVDSMRDKIRRNVGSFIRYVDLYPWQNVSFEIFVVDELPNKQYQSQQEQRIQQLELFNVY